MTARSATTAAVSLATHARRAATTALRAAVTAFRPSSPARRMVEIVSHREHGDDVGILRVFIDGEEHTPDLWFHADLGEDFDLDHLRRDAHQHAAHATPAAARAIHACRRAGEISALDGINL